MTKYAIKLNGDLIKIVDSRKEATLILRNHIQNNNTECIGTEDFSNANTYFLENGDEISIVKV